jgi:hypothetical protein
VIRSALFKVPLPPARELKWRRIRFIASITFFGGTIGTATVIVSILSRTPLWQDPGRLELVPGLFVYGSGTLAGMLLSAVLAYWSHAEGHRQPLGIVLWLLLGAGYGLLLPFLTGAIFVPFSSMLFDLYQGLLDPVEAVNASIDIVLTSPVNAVIGGALLLRAGLIAGPIFGMGAWMIDKSHTSAHAGTARYGSWTTALVLGIAVLVFAAFAPAALLARLG